jgi:hypothetical protein
MAYKVTTEDLEAINATIEALQAITAKFADMEAINAEIETLLAMYAELVYVSAGDLEAVNAIIENLEVMFGEFTNISAEDLEAINAEIQNLKAYNADFTYVSAEVLEAMKAAIKELEVNSLTVEEADIRYANIDFANIGEAAIRKIFADSGLIRDLVVGDTTITGELVGVTIKGDWIEAGTLKADKLVVLGDDGLYYKLNIEAGAVASEEVSEEELQNGLHGTAIIAKTITAEKIAVDDLVAFDATIGGFNITKDSIYSGVKETVDNGTRGVYMDRDGQFAVGDGSNYLRYFKDADGKYKLAIAAGSIILAASGKTVEETVQEAVDGIEWGTLLLFGGGLSLGHMMYVTGLSKWIGTGITSSLGEPNLLVMIAVFSLLSLFLSELASHTAATNMVGPLGITAALSAGFDPTPVAVAIALSASLGFMLPVSTPPNAIVYASGFVPITKMIRTGFIIDLIGIFLITIPIVVYFVTWILS